LEDVIENIERFSPDPERGNYYEQKSLTLEIKSGTDLCALMQDKGLIK